MVMAAVLATMGACSQSTSEPGAVKAPSSGPTSSQSTSDPSSPSHSGPTSKPPKSPPAPGTVKPVPRDGHRPHPSISAAPQPFDQPVTYSDGVRLTVTAIHQGRVSGQGVGIVEGPRTTFDLRFSNGSKRAINLNQVVPTVEFGKPARIAQPVYDDKTQDFAGVVRPGGHTTATYAFSIPVGQLDDVTVHLDFDGRHLAAVFQGAATSG